MGVFINSFFFFYVLSFYLWYFSLSFINQMWWINCITALSSSSSSLSLLKNPRRGLFSVYFLNASFTITNNIHFFDTNKFGRFQKRFLNQLNQSAFALLDGQKVLFCFSFTVFIKTVFLFDFILCFQFFFLVFWFFFNGVVLFSVYHWHSLSLFTIFFKKNQLDSNQIKTTLQKQ